MKVASYGLVADVHAHGWSQFAKINADGSNSRLTIVLDELKRAAQTTIEAGGKALIIAGDLFHRRGAIEPAVFNPTFDTIAHIAIDLALDVIIIPGNHDLAGRNADELGNAMQKLDMIDGVEVIIEPTVLKDRGVVMLPWIEDLDELREVAKKLADPKLDLIMHAPMNGVLMDLPNHGLEPAEVAKWGYKRVFTGHYHNHKAWDTGVYSIGATAHQTWNDPDTAAGFLVVYSNKVEHHDTLAPKFVNHDGEDPIDAKRYAGNYVRMRLKDADEDLLKTRKQQLLDLGALGVVDHSSKKREVRRGQASVGNVTIDASVANFVDQHLDTLLDRQKVQRMALDVLNEARNVGDTE